MSRKLVLVCAFLAVLPVIALSMNARGGGPPKKERAEAESPFGNNEKPADAKPKPSSGPEVHGGKQAILKALKQSASIECDGTPLADVITYLSKQYRIPIRLDTAVLKEAGLACDTPVSCKLSGISLRAALEIILDDLKLKWAIHHDVLIITTQDKAESDEYMESKCYDVTDLVVPSKQVKLQNPVKPRNEDQGTGGMMVAQAASAGMGGYSYRVEMPLFNFQDLVSLITNIVDIKTWQDNGGTGTIAFDDGLLIVSQSQEVHRQIEEFLDNLRARRKARPVLSVELRWLWLDAKHRGHLIAGRAKAADGQVSLAVDRKRLRQLTREVPEFHARVASVSGLPAVVAAGDRRAIILNTIPVVGGAIGYQPVISVPNVGVTAKVSATFVPGTKTAMLDIGSIITRWGPERKAVIVGKQWPAGEPISSTVPAPTPPKPAAASPNPAALGQGGTIPAPTATPAVLPPWFAPPVATPSAPGSTSSCPVDQPVVPTQQIGGTLRVPLGEPVIVGSITFDPAGDAGLDAAKENPIEVYLIATTSIVREAGK